jgi:hypothetical protein
MRNPRNRHLPLGRELRKMKRHGERVKHTTHGNQEIYSRSDKRPAINFNRNHSTIMIKSMREFGGSYEKQT